MPISKKPARRGWELYVGKDNRLEEFEYHGGKAAAIKGYTGTWQGYEKAGPLLLSTDHEGTTDDGKSVRVFYSDVAVKLVGSDKWVNAQPASKPSASQRIARQ